MKDNYTHIIFLLDRSGSMFGQHVAAMEGLNKFVEVQKKSPGTATMSLALFDHEFTELYHFAPIAEVRPITEAEYKPRGSTALLDAIGKAIDDTGLILHNMDESSRPDKVIVAILTDGMENASRVYSAHRIKEMIQHQEQKYSWQITYLSSDIKASEQALTYGFSVNNVTVDSIQKGFQRYTDLTERTRGLGREAYVKNVSNFFNPSTSPSVSPTSNSNNKQ